MLGWTGQGALGISLLLAGSLLLSWAPVIATIGLCAAFGRLGPKTTMVYGGIATLVSTALIALFHELPAIGDAVAFVVAPMIFLPLTCPRARRLRMDSRERTKATQGMPTCPKEPAFLWKLAATAFVQGFSYGAVYLWFPQASATESIFAFDMAGLLLAGVFLVCAEFVARLNFNRLIYLGSFSILASSYLLLLVCGQPQQASLLVKNAGYAALDISVVSLSAHLVRNLRLSAAWVALCPSVWGCSRAVSPATSSPPSSQGAPMATARCSPSRCS
jgi:hypothetical protein